MFKSMQTIAAVFLTVFSIPASALSLSGDLVVADSLRVKRTDGFKARIYKGKYKTELWNVGKTDMTLRVERKGAFIDVPIQVAPSHRIPGNGSFSIPGNHSNQTFDASGVAKSDRKQSATQRGYERCTYLRDEYVCRPRRRPRRPRRHRPPRCRWETVEVEGERDIEFHFVTTKYDLNLTLQSAGNRPAKFAASKTERKRVVTHRGRCF